MLTHPNLADFLNRAPKGFQLMQTEDSLGLVAENLFEQLVEDGVIYAEIRFAPLLHTADGLAESVVKIVEATTDRMIRSSGVDARLILCTLRHFTESQSLETVRLVHRFHSSHVVALDLAADEAGFPLDAHLSAYQYAREHGLFRTAHAGEASGPQSVWETLRLLQPTRIGHGTRSIEDHQLIEHLKHEHIHLEICPSSNVQIIPSIAEWEDHPVDQLYRAGVSLSINTDSRMLTSVTLTGEYESLAHTFEWGPEELLQTNLMAVDAAFIDEATKEHLRTKLLHGYNFTSSV